MHYAPEQQKNQPCMARWHLQLRTIHNMAHWLRNMVLQAEIGASIVRTRHGVFINFGQLNGILYL